MLAATVFAFMVVAVGAGLTLPWTSPRVEVLPPVGIRISRDTLARRFGIELTHVAVTHAGALVELRFTVLDTLKARQLLEATPRLLAEDSGYTLQAPSQGPWRSIRLQKGASCFVLFPNARSTVKPGSRVSLVVGGVRVEAVVAM